MIADNKPTCHVKLGGYFLRQIKDFAEMSFGESFMHAKLNRKDVYFEVWVTHEVNENSRKKFEDKFKQCKILVFEAKNKSKK